MREGLNHLCFPTYYRGPFVASNIANMYCTECIIGIIQNAGTPSRLRFARTRRDEGRRERQASNYGSPFLHTTEIHSQRPNIANLALDLRSILAMIVPVLVGPLAGHANSLSAPPRWWGLLATCTFLHTPGAHSFVAFKTLRICIVQNVL